MSSRRLIDAARRRLRRSVRRATPATTPTPSGGLAARARRATEEGRWADAVEAWTAVLDAGEGPAATAMTRLASAHRHLGDLAAATAVLDRGLERFPQHVGLATERAQVAVTARDWEAAVPLWREVLDLRGEPDARTLARLARAETRLGDLEAATATLERAHELFPDDAGIAADHAKLASVAQDWPEAARRWQGVLAVTEPQPPAQAFSQLAKAYQQLEDLDRADAVLERGLGTYPDDLDLLSRHAKIANARRDWPEVVRRWNAVLDVAGRDAPPLAYVQLGRAHQAQGDLDAAEQVLELGRQRHPQDVEVATRWAKLAAVARHWDVAFERYGVAVALPAGAPPQTHRDRARAAAELKAWDAAELALRTGLSEHPGDPMLLVERAFHAIHRGDWDAVDARWSEATSAADGPVPAALYVGMARRCAAAFDHRRADRVIEEALTVHPEDRGVQRQLVRNAISEQRRERPPSDWDWTEAAARASRVVATYRTSESSPDDHLDLAAELADATAVAEAAAVLREGLLRFPDSTPLRHEIALLAAARGEWPEVVEQLEPRATREGASVATRSELARAYLGCDDPAAAARVIGEPSDASPDAALLHRELAWIATREGALDVAVERYRRAAELDPGSVRGRRELAVALRRAGDEDAAREVVESARRDGVALESNPGVVAIIGGGPSLRGVDLTPLRDRAHTVAVNATATVLPWTDVAVTHDASHLAERFRGYDRPVVAGLPIAALRTWGRLPGFEFRRRLVIDRLSEFDGILHSGGHTSAHTALNYAYLLRPRRIVLFGVDLTDFWGPNDYWHSAMDDFNRRRFAGLEAQPTFDRWSAYRSRKLLDAPAVFASTVPQLDDAGTEVLNASPVSSLDCFTKGTPEEGVAAATADDLAG